MIVARDYVPPFREHFDWPSFSLTFAPEQVGAYMLKVLRAVPQAQLEEMQVGGQVARHSSTRFKQKDNLAEMQEEG